MLSRYQSIKLQSPGQSGGYHSAYKEQIDRFNVKDSSASDQFFEIKKGEDLHHIRQQRLLYPLFKNTTPEQAKQLAGAVGNVNAIQNLIGVEKRGHQGDGPGSEMAVHNLLRERGLTTEAKRSTWHPLIQEIEMAGKSNFAYKMHLANRYIKELKPEIDKALNDAMTHYSEIDVNRSRLLGGARRYRASFITGDQDPQMQARWRQVQNTSSPKQLPVTEDYYRESRLKEGETLVKLPVGPQQTPSQLPM